ncbi:MAG TPA: 4-amino-4-deoxychorismate lyase, partial [Cyanobacteria bacterium UBA11049]|nr:4-amino-4-deoxychorismate lyase [Cyanobacteria bacterium UBA11049]
CVWLAAAEQFQRCLPGYKTGNYLSAWMAKNTAQQLGAGEATLL